MGGAEIAGHIKNGGLFFGKGKIHGCGPVVACVASEPNPEAGT